MYRAITEMTVSPSLTDRIAACLATLSTPNPRAVAVDKAYAFASSEGWAAAWQSAVDSYNVNQNPDTGARTDVISDEMISSACEAVMGVERYASPDGGTTTKRPADEPIPVEDGGPSFEEV